MRRIAVFLGFTLVAVPCCASAQQKSNAQEIDEAVSALPEQLRDGAAVRSFKSAKLVTIREGTNGMICLADDPSDDTWHVACYHESLEPFMARGRALRAEGITDRAAIDSIREAEIESGRLTMPSQPTALYSLSGARGGGNAASGPAGARGLWVIYIPFATEESTGISARPSREQPWLMNPGKPWAHVMIPRGPTAARGPDRR